jgi:transcription antitermination factor NusG
MPKILKSRPKFHDQTEDLAAQALSRWYAAYTIPRHEKRVAELLSERNIDAFLPLYQESRKWKKSSPALLDLPLFPCYLFVRIGRNERVSVLSTPGVLSIVGSSKEPWELPHLEIEALRFGAQMRTIGPHPYLVVGERVRIKAGSMAGLEGILVRKKNEVRFVLTLDAIMRSVAVEIDASELEPVNPGADLSSIVIASQAHAFTKSQI